MDPDYRNITQETLQNTKYRQVLYTLPNRVQLVLMTLMPGEDIPEEKHDGVQIFTIVKGSGLAMVQMNLKSKVYSLFRLEPGYQLVVPAGHNHYITNTDSDPNGSSLHMYTWYSPPEHSSKREDIRQPK